MLTVGNFIFDDSTIDAMMAWKKCWWINDRLR